MQEVDLVLRNAKYLDADKREFVEGDIAIKDGKIVGINGIFSGKEEKDLTGKYITPGFIDGHIHLESSVISPEDLQNSKYTWNNSSSYRSTRNSKCMWNRWNKIYVRKD